MSIASSFIMAGLLGSATPVSQAPWITDQDYPQSAKERREEGLVRFTVLIGPDGRKEECVITRSSGFADLDQRTCELIQKRARFKPAHDETGQLAFGTYRGAIPWILPDNVRADRFLPIGAMLAADLDIQVAALPKNTRDRDFYVVGRIAADGKITACEPAASRRQSDALGQTACTQLRSNWKVPFFRVNGSAIPVVQTFKISFQETPS
jgi:TonB family protein